MNKSYTISKAASEESKSEFQDKTVNEPVTAPEKFNYDTYGDTKKSLARIGLTHEQLVQSVIFSEIFGPPVSRRNRFGRK